ncbi:protease complex subunit PrcB family protein [Deinococcus cavernae]|uniref:Protease complex subunit PrcB family protein n=1 Tax=Deinococcus cavernae TaxID=2320857 RepID=A0A418VBH7_9DEIO|nr:protease complex subunit PrcB family protein [Deinococcus cavernae]RJF73493.1 protease complex subunit PrcB family protein [Deinococcus cavernae]
MTTTVKSRLSLAVVALGTALLAGCTATGPSNLRVHEVALSGGANQRIAWVYGTLSGPSSSLKLNGNTLEVRPQVQDDLSTPGSLSVNGKATYQVSTASSAQKLSVTQDAAGRFNLTAMNSASLLAVYYTDGTNWWKLNGISGTVSATPSTGLRGAGQLTDDEGDALARALDGQGSLAVAVLNENPTPLSVEPKPTEHRMTSLYVLPGIRTTTGGTTGTVTMNPGSSNTGNSRPSAPAAGFTEVARGANARVDDPTVRIATTTAELGEIYRLAYGNQSSPPTPTPLNNETAVAVFIGQRTTGGYGVRVERVVASGGTLNVTVAIQAPQAGMITTQALTSPWVLVKVPGVFTQVNVVDMAGQPLP